MSQFRAIEERAPTLNLDEVKETTAFSVVNPVNGPGAGSYFIKVEKGQIAGTFRLTQRATNVQTGAEYSRIFYNGTFTSWINLGGAAAALYYYDAISYGADRTGATSSRTTLQAAIDAAEADGGGEVYLPYGIYSISFGGTASAGGLIIPSNVTLRGDGPGRTIIRAMDLGNHDMSGLVRTASGEENSNITIRDLTLDGNKSAQTGWANVVPFYAGVTPGNRSLKDRDIHLINVEAINGRNGTTGSDHDGGGGYGFDPHEICDRIVFINCIAHDNEEDGFVLDGCTNFIVDSCQSYSNGRHGFNNTTETEYGLYANCHAYLNASNGFLSAEDSNNIVYSGGSARGNTLEGFKIRRGNTVSDTNITVTGMLITDNGRHGVAILGATNNNIIGNTIRNNSATTNNTYDSVRLGKDSTYTSTSAEYNTIEANVFSETGANKARYAVNEVSTEADNNRILWNTTRGHVNSAIYNVSGASTILRYTDLTMGSLLPAVSAPATPPAGYANLHGVNRGSSIVIPGFVDPLGQKKTLQESLAGTNFCSLIGGPTTALQTGTSAPTVTGTGGSGAISASSRAQSLRRTTYTSAASTNAGAGVYHTQNQVFRCGGFRATFAFSLKTIDAANTVFFTGLDAQQTGLLATSTGFASAVAMAGFGFTAGQTNFRFLHNDASGAFVAVDLGATVPVSVNVLYEGVIYAKYNDSTLYYSLMNMETGAVVSGSVSADLPGPTTGLAMQLGCNTGSGSAAAAVEMVSMMVQSGAA